MDTPEKKPKIPKQGTELEDKLKKFSKEKERQKKIDEVARHLHPHDDEPDPTAYMKL